MSSQMRLRVEGAVAKPLELSFEELSGWPADAQVRDVSRFQSGRHGDGVTLEAILARVETRPGVAFLNLHGGDDFHVSIPLEAVRAQAVVVYRLEDRPLEPAQGGPFRFLIRDPAACHTAELDDCANVKYLTSIDLSIERGRDTRPHTPREHDALHEAERDRERALPPDEAGGDAIGSW